MSETDQPNPSPHSDDAMAVVHDAWGRSEPKSLINLTSTACAEMMIEAGRKRPDLLGVDERTLIKLLREEKASPTPTDNRLRIAFWMEYERAHANNAKMEMTAVFDGVCTKGYFYNVYLACAPKVAWLVCQPSSYDKYAQEAINFGLEQLRDVLELPHARYDEDGKLIDVNLKLAELKAKIIFGLEARHKGAVIQRVEQKNMNLHISSTDKTLSDAAMGGTMEDIDRRLAEIRRRQAKARAELTDESETKIEFEVTSEVTESKP